jgi:putative addiction module CopG family antidote
MEIRLPPELENLIKQDVQRGSYETVDEFVECAVSMLHEQEAWLAQLTDRRIRGPEETRFRRAEWFPLVG